MHAFDIFAACVVLVKSSVLVVFLMYCCGWRRFSISNTLDRYEKRVKDQGLGSRAVQVDMEVS